jgi:hypothetical protein
MNGWKIGKAKETIIHYIWNMNPYTFNLISFSGGMGKAFEQPAMAMNVNPGTTDQ